MCACWSGKQADCSVCRCRPWARARASPTNADRWACKEAPSAVAWNRLESLDLRWKLAQAQVQIPELFPGKPRVHLGPQSLSLDFERDSTQEGLRTALRALAKCDR